MRTVWLSLLALLPLLLPAAPLRTFTVTDALQHRWSDELVHFDFAVKAQGPLMLTDAAGVPVPCQFTGLARTKDGSKGTVWTVLNLEPGATATLALVPGTATATTGLALAKTATGWVLRNERLALYLPLLPGTLATPTPLTQLPAPLAAVGMPGGARWGQGSWTADAALLVTAATTRVLEEGPVRITVEQRYMLADGRSYAMTLRLAARQEVALVDEDGTIAGAAFHLALRPGLGADHVLWHNQWKSTSLAKSWELTDTATAALPAGTSVCTLRPWSFWWDGGVTMWAGFFNKQSDALVGLLALRPARWSPYGGAAFATTQLPVTAGPDRLDIDFPLITGVNADKSVAPLHREWGITVGTAAAQQGEKNVTQLRRQLIKYSEFPLDEVKEYACDFTPVAHPHPALLFSAADVQRLRTQLKDPAARPPLLVKNLTYTERCVGNHLEKHGAESFYQNVYWGTGLTERLPEAYLASDDERYARGMAVAVKGLAKDLKASLLETPYKPAIGALGPWYTDAVMRLLLAYDMMAGSPYLTPADERDVRAVLVLAAHLLAHPDYWNLDRGLCSGNPNMTSAILLPEGLLALTLDGHPKSTAWLRGAEQELQVELADFTSPGGAWIECPGYQSASLDAMFVIAQAIKNITGRDYFADKNFSATMDYYGFITTPPDLRFPPGRTAAQPAVRTVPTIGDTPAGFISIFQGWMAKATAQRDPAYSARQQFHWLGQGATDVRAGRAGGYALALTDLALPAAPPAELSRGFPGFGSALRTSWTDATASYVAHRTGPHAHHYHDDYGSFIYFAKGAPLCMDFGNQYAPLRREEAWYHNRVSVAQAASAQKPGSTGALVQVSSLPATADLSVGRTEFGDGSKSLRTLLLVKAADPLGANYLVVRDENTGNPASKRFYWNLWCLATGVEGIGADGRLAADARGNAAVVHFPGQFGVDLDLHLAQPAAAQATADRWEWTNQVNCCGVIGPVSELQHGVHLWSDDAVQDQLAVLTPRAAGQPAAVVRALAGGAGVRVTYAEGTDWVLLAARQPATLTEADVTLSGTRAYVRKSGAALRLAVMSPDATAAAAGWTLRGDGPVSLHVTGTTVSGESSGDAHTATLTLPAALGKVTVQIDGKPATAPRTGQTLTLTLPAGAHAFTVK